MSETPEISLSLSLSLSLSESASVKVGLREIRKQSSVAIGFWIFQVHWGKFLRALDGAIRFLQSASRHRVTNRILIAAKRSGIAVIRFGLLSICNEHVATDALPEIETCPDYTASNVQLREKETATVFASVSLSDRFRSARRTRVSFY